MRRGTGAGPIRGRRRLAAILLFVTACGAPDPIDGWRGVRDTIAEVEIVRNPAEPLHTAGAVRATPLWSAPAAAEAERLGDWEQPAIVRVDGGRLYVLDRMAHRVHVLDRATGQWTHSVGRRGGGPGEFERAFGIVARDGELVVGNGGRATLERFTPDGAHLGSMHIGQMAFSLHPLGDRFLVSGMLGSTAGHRRVAADGSADLVEFPDDPALSDLGAHRGCARVSTGDDRIYRLDCIRPAFQVLDAAGTHLRTVLVDRPAVTVADAAIEQYLATIRTTMAQQAVPPAVIEQMIASEREGSRFERRMRVVRTEQRGDRLALWEQGLEEFGGGPATLHFFSDDGVFLASAAFDAPWVDFAWADETLYALAQDPDTGLVRLTAYRLAL